MAQSVVIAIMLAGVVGMALGTLNEMQLVGRFDTQICAPDDPACIRPAPSGVNLTIWHGDRSCSVLYLYCALDRFVLTLESPAHLTHHSFCAMGLVPDSRDNQCCKKYNAGIVGSRALTPHRTKYQYAFSGDGGANSCGTVALTTSGDFGSENRQYTNKVEIIEFLEQTLPRQSPVISLISHTHIDIKCCNDRPIIDADCDIEQPFSEQSLTRCTEKQFTFTCTSSEERESFHCFVELKEHETLQTEDVGFTLDTCTARPVGVAGEQVTLFANGNPDSNLQIGSGVCGERPADPVDKRVYSIEGPWIQWGEDNCDLHEVQIDCTVKVVAKASLPAVGNDVDFCRTPPGYTSSRSGRAGFFQAGKLDIIQ